MRGCVAALATVAALASSPVLSGCSLLPWAQGTPSLIVPALWASPDHTESGIEPAGIIVDPSPDGGYGVDLADIAAEGAGKSWQAATAAAATTATLLSGTDPETVSIRYTVTGPIDGPSAGAILTVGTIAAIRGDLLKPGVTMTGTVSPNGAIGRIGGAKMKIGAAAAAGYSTVLLPVLNATLDQDAPDNATGDAVTYGKSLGVDVILVSNIKEAYIRFTGSPLLGTAMNPQALVTPVVTAAGMEQARTLARSALEAAATVTDPAQAARAAEKATGALNTSDPAIAYARAVDARRTAQQALAKQASEAAIARDGLPATAAAVSQEADELAEAAAAAVMVAAEGNVAGQGQIASLTASLHWLTLGEAYLHAATAVMDPASRASVVQTAMIVADQRISIEQIWPDSAGLIDISPKVPGVADHRRAAAFIDGYSGFLQRTGDANRAYLAQSLHLTDKQFATLDPLSRDKRIHAVVTWLADATSRRSAGRGQGQLPGALVDNAYAMSYAAMTSLEVDANQTRLSGQTESSLDWPVTVDEVTNGLWLTQALAERSLGRGIAVPATVWAARWAAELPAAAAGDELQTAETVLAAREMWFTVIATAMLDAIKNPYSETQG
ncbi:MAG: hypothetical protein K9G24_06740 [Candidatus Nanopelagicales bacterium]|nr:hypothetical protein [Candidatus Nanopelagicales bacterium]MCF8537796.1 hypothetical protein [Candidatus Nanopelagicales bacterium]MCF8542761.1 hypothetical protein [Candidatus Nanopelagicales bacterium]MCF8557224.1 hypothetical protein [Candidatus Nanopelagicales bacterium]